MVDLSYLKTPIKQLPAILKREMKIIHDRKFLITTIKNASTVEEKERIQLRVDRLDTHLKEAEALIKSELENFTSVDFALLLHDTNFLGDYVFETEAKWMPMLRKREMAAYKKLHSVPTYEFSI